MPVEKSAGAIIFRREPAFAKASAGKKDKIYYLFLHYPSATHRAEKPRSRASTLRGGEYWGLPKGHIEKGENIFQTAIREVFEETGLNDLQFVKGFKETIKYFFKWEGKNILKFVTFLLAETKTKDIKISEEHLGFAWLPFETGVKKLTFKNAKEILKKADKFLSTKSI